MIFIYLGIIFTGIFFVVIGLQNSLVRYRDRIESSIKSMSVLLEKRELLLEELVHGNPLRIAIDPLEDLVEDIRMKRKNLESNPFSAPIQLKFEESEEELKKLVNDLESNRPKTEQLDRLTQLECSLKQAKIQCNEAIASYNLTRKTFPNQIICRLFGYLQMQTFRCH